MSDKLIRLEQLIYYDEKIKEYIDNNVPSGDDSEIEIYDDYSKLPSNLTEKTIAYCENDYVDNTSTTTYGKGLYFYNINNSTWELITINVDVDLSELEEALDKIDNMVTQNDLKDYLDKDTYMSEINEGNIKSADVANSIKGVELAKPYQFFGVDATGEAKFQYLPIQGDGQVTQGNFEQREIVDAKANKIYEIGSLNGLGEGKIFAQAYTEIEGQQNMVDIIKEFNNEHKDSFYYGNNVEFDEGVKIKTRYNYQLSKNSDNFYETQIIKKDDFIKFQGIEV